MPSHRDPAAARVRPVASEQAVRWRSSRMTKAIDEHAFDILDAQKAWMLGMLWADGSLSLPQRNTGHYIIVASIDQWIPQMFKTILKSDACIVEVSRSHLGPKWHNLFRFQPGGLHYLGPKLERLGMAKLKPERIPPTILPDELIRDFIRGIFDADGYAGMSKHKSTHPEVSIAGYMPMLEWIQLRLPGKIHRLGNIFRLCCAVKHMPDWYDYLYYPECICIERKRSEFVKIRERCSFQV